MHKSKVQLVLQLLEEEYVCVCEMSECNTGKGAFIVAWEKWC